MIIIALKTLIITLNITMGNIFGRYLQLVTWGESHGEAMGLTLDGCPPGIPITSADIQHELDRRRPHQSTITSQRREKDQVEILSGLYKNQTLGTPLTLLIRNTNPQPYDYEATKRAFRPSHADYTYYKKYSTRQPTGGGRASARETVCRVAAGAVAKKILAYSLSIHIRAYVTQIHTIKLPSTFNAWPTAETIESNAVRCPDPLVAAKMIQCIENIKAEGDSVGGIIQCVIKNCPIGLGAPVFDKLEADLAKAMLSIPATKGFEIGSGFNGVTLKGSEHNDPFVATGNHITTLNNNSGGIQGGISNGEAIFFRVAFKPTSTIQKKQQTVTHCNKPTTIEAKGRHDPCVVPRAVPIVEAMAALTLADHWMAHIAQTQSFATHNTSILSAG